MADGSGLGLFDSGPKAGGTSFGFTFFGAGGYRAVEDGGGSSQVLFVDPSVSANTSSENPTYTVTWSSTRAPSGLVFDVQIERPGGASFRRWKVAETAGSASLSKNARPGTYRFRSRVRQVGSGIHTRWSRPVSLTVIVLAR